MEQVQNEAAYRQLLVQGALAVLLPTEDLRNPCLRTIVSDVIADMILGTGIGGKASSSWLIWDGIAKTLSQSKNIVYQRHTNYQLKPNVKHRSENLQLSSTGRERQAPASLGILNTARISSRFWRILQFIYMVLIVLRYLMVGLWSASGIAVSNIKPVRNFQVCEDHVSPIVSNLEAPSLKSMNKRPILTYSIFELISQLLELQSRVPLILGWLTLIRHHLVDGILHMGATGAILDK